MNYKVIAVPEFRKQFKRLSKKYHSLKTELAVLIEILEKNPMIGIELVDNVYKIRLAIASKGKGKSGGARIITYVKVNESIILLLSIYNKGEQDNITDKELLKLLKKYIK